MFGSINYFVDTFKTRIMTNYASDAPCSIHNQYTRLLEEISEYAQDFHEKKRCEKNIEKAYKLIRIELFGWEERENEK